MSVDPGAVAAIQLMLGDATNEVAFKTVQQALTGKVTLMDPFRARKIEDSIFMARATLRDLLGLVDDTSPLGLLAAKNVYAKLINLERDIEKAIRLF